MIIAEGINDAWLQVLNNLNTDGVVCSPRGKTCKELLNVSVKINNPKKRILSLPIRKISLPYAFGELIWYLSGSNKLDVMEYYSANMKQFSDDGETLNSAYGYRMFGYHPAIPFDQWVDVRNRLIADDATRQAIVHLHTPNNAFSKDEVCTLTLQFLVRDTKLDMVVNMRSNDIILGFTYDVFAFTSLQELMANELGIEVGAYYHNAASMHIYEKDQSYLNPITSIYSQLMYMTKYDTEFSYGGMVIGSIDFDVLLHNEHAARIGAKLIQSTNTAVKTMTDILSIFHQYKFDSQELVLKRLDYDNIYHCMMRSFIHRNIPLWDSNLVIIEGCEAAGKTTYTYENGVGYGFDVIHFGKPNNFNKLLYFQYSMMTGDVMLDRFFYSEIVYSAFYDRACSLDEKDAKVLESLLNYRQAKMKLLDTPSSVCYKRLNEADAAEFTKANITTISMLYRLIFSESLLDNKEMV